jgi:hypothetical protein
MALHEWPSQHFAWEYGILPYARGRGFDSRCKVPQCFHLAVFPSLFGEHSKTGKTRFSVCPYSCQVTAYSVNVLLGNIRIWETFSKYCLLSGNMELCDVNGLRRIMCAVYRYSFIFGTSDMNKHAGDEVWCGGGMLEECNSGSYWLCHSEGHVICNFLIIHGGSFGYKMFSILRARQNALTTTSFRARRIPAPHHAACANNNIIPLRI